MPSRKLIIRMTRGCNPKFERLCPALMLYPDPLRAAGRSISGAASSRPQSQGAYFRPGGGAATRDTLHLARYSLRLGACEGLQPFVLTHGLLLSSSLNSGTGTGGKIPCSES